MLDLNYIRISAKRLYIINYLGGVCSKCGEKRTNLLNCHHIEPNSKKFTIGSTDLSIRNIIEEADKCILLCYNCHREYHCNDYFNDERRKIMKTRMLDYKNTKKCSICGYSKNIAALDFHHINKGEKEFDLSRLIGPTTELIDVVKLELDKCEVLCSNCHHDLHFDYEKYLMNYDAIFKKSKNIKSIHSKINRETVYDMYVNKNIRKVDIARYFNVSKGTITDILKKYGLYTKKEYLLLDENLILKLHSEGLTCTEIGRKINKNANCVFQVIKRNNLDTNIKHERINLRKFNPDVSQLIELHKTLSYSKIGKIYGVSGNAVKMRINKYIN